MLFDDGADGVGIAAIAVVDAELGPVLLVVPTEVRPISARRGSDPCESPGRQRRRAPDR